MPDDNSDTTPQSAALLVRTLPGVLLRATRTHRVNTVWLTGNVRQSTAWIAALEQSTPAGIGGTSASKMTVG